MLFFFYFAYFLSTTEWAFFIYTRANNGGQMIFKDKEVINLLKAIERKLDIVIAMKKSDKIKQASRNIKKGE